MSHDVLPTNVPLARLEVRSDGDLLWEATGPVRTAVVRGSRSSLRDYGARVALLPGAVGVVTPADEARPRQW